MRTGRDCVRFLARNEEYLDIYYEWKALGRKPDPAQDPLKWTRREIIFRRRMVGLIQAGKFTVEEYFRLQAWLHRVRLAPGFLTNESRCDR